MPWIRKVASVNFARYNTGEYEIEDVVQEGCVAAIMTAGNNYPLDWMRVRTSVQDFARAPVRRKARYEDYDDRMTGSRLKLCRSIDVKTAIRKLEKYERAVVILHYYFGMTDSEIAEKLKLCRDSIMKKRHSAIRRLYEILH